MLGTRMQKLDLFIICPIGAANSGDRAHSNKIKSMILNPAIRRLEETLNVTVSAEIDHFDISARDIVQGIVRKIIHYDIIVAFIYDENPNVFYELGIAHSAGREVVILFETDRGRETLPFDLRGRSCITYGRGDLEQWREGELLDKRDTLVNSLHDALLATYRNRSDRPLAFNSEQLDPLGSRHAKYVLHERFTEALPYHDLRSAEFYQSATQYIALTGVSLLQLTEDADNWKLQDGKSISFMKFLAQLANAKQLTIDLFIMHPDNPALESMLKTFVGRAGDSTPQAAVVRDEIEESTARWLHMIEFLQSLGSAGAIRLLRLKRGIPYNRLSLTDNALIATPYFYHSTNNGTGPALQVTRDTSLYQLVRKDLDFLRSSPSTEVLGLPLTQVLQPVG